MIFIWENFDQATNKAVRFILKENCAQNASLAISGRLSFCDKIKLFIFFISHSAMKKENYFVSIRNKIKMQEQKKKHFILHRNLKRKIC